MTEEDLAYEAMGFDEPSSEVDALAFNVVGAAIEVHQIPGPGHSEEAYHKALCIEPGLRGIRFESERRYDLQCKGHPVGSGRLDLLVEDLLVVELKSCEAFSSVHTAQVLSCLMATNRQSAPLINFNVSRLKDGIGRIARTR